MSFHGIFLTNDFLDFRLRNRVAHPPPGQMSGAFRSDLPAAHSRTTKISIFDFFEIETGLKTGALLFAFYRNSSSELPQRRHTQRYEQEPLKRPGTSNFEELL